MGTPLNDARTERGGVIAGHPSHHAKLIENITMTAAIAVAFIWRLPRGTARVRIPDPSDPQSNVSAPAPSIPHRESVTVRRSGEQRTPR